MKPGDQRLEPQVVVPHYTKNSKTDFFGPFWVIFWQFLPIGSTHIITPNEI